MKTPGNNEKIESNKQFPKEYSLILNFPEKKKSFSLGVPSNWTFYRLKKFIFSEFIEEIRSPKPFLLYQANPLNNTYNDKLLSSIFKENKINFLLVLVKKVKKNKEENEDNKEKKELEKEKDPSSFYFKTKSEILASDEFSFLEEGVYKAYSKVIQSKKIKESESPLQTFPLMHYAVSQRIEAINKKDPLLSLSSFEPGRLEYYPLREYFNFNLILRLLLTFIIFNLSNHLYKFIFLLFLIGYYWYSMYILVDAFYEKKKEEIKLSEDELKEIKSVFSSVEIEKKIDLLINQKDKQINIELANQNEDDQKEENENDPNDNNEQNNIDLGANPNRFVGGQNLRFFLNQKGNNIRNQVFVNEMMGIEHLLEKKDKEKQQNEENINNVNDEQQIIRVLKIIGKCLYLLFITLIPNWTDEFERENPFPNERNAQNNNNNDDNNENNNNNSNNEMSENNNNQNIETNNIIQNENINININNANINNELENLIEHHDNDNDEKHNTEDMKNNTSSKDVNLSEDLVKEPRHKIFNKKSHFDSASKKESEFVFSDHENIDNLSNEDEPNIIDESKEAKS